MNRFRIARVLPFLVVLGGFALRLYHLGTDSLWYDETVSLLLARSDVGELLRHTAGDIHPPFYYLLLHWWGQLAGWSEFSAAFLSLWFGVLLIALVYRAARNWLAFPFTTRAGLGARVALVAALLVAVSPYNVWYSQEVRMYTLGAALGLASVFFLVRLLRGSRVLSLNFLAYVIVTALGLYTLYYFIFLMVFEYAFVVYYVARLAPRASRTTNHSSLSSRPSALVTFVVSQIAIFLLYLPWLPIAFRQATDPPVPPWRNFVALPQMLIESFSALSLGQSVDPLTVAPLLVVLLGLIVFLQLAAHRSRLTAVFLFGYVFIPLFAIFLFSLWKPLYHVRYIFTFSPPFYILLALAIYIAGERAMRVNRAGRYLAPALVGIYLLGAVYSLNNFWNDSRYVEDDLRGAVGHIAENWRPGDAILVDAGYAYPALEYYFPAPVPARERLSDFTPTGGEPVMLTTGSIGGSPRLGWGDPRSDFYATTAEETRAALDRVFAAYPRVWLLRIYDTVTDPDGVIRQYFAEHGQLIDDEGFSGEANARVQGYLTGATKFELATPTPIEKVLDGRIELQDFESGARELHPGDFYDAILYWKPLETLNNNYQLSLQLLDGSGGLAAQNDETPLGSELPTSRWKAGETYREPVRVRLPASLAPAIYRVIVKLYNPRDGAVLGEPIELGTVQVVQ